MAQDEESCLVGGYLSTVLRLSRFHGVAAINLKPLGNSYVARICNSGVLYSWLLFTGLSVAGFVGIVMDLQFYGTSKAIRVTNLSATIVWFNEITMIRTIIFFALFDGRTRIENLLRYLKQIEKVNKGMGCDLTQQFNEKILNAGVIGLLVTSYISDLASFGLQIFYAYTNKQEMIVLFLYGLHFFEDNMALLLLMQVACFVIRLQSAFKQINKRLGELLDIQELNTRRSLRDIANSYVQLCCVVRDFNEENGCMIFVMFSATVTSLFINSYHLLLTLCLPDLEGVLNRFYSIILIVIWFLSHFTKIFVLVEPCHRTHEEMKKTNVLLNKVTYHLTPIGCPVLTELDIFHKQVILCKTTFSPLGVFTLHRSLIATVIAALATFMVFIKQYRIIVECK